MPADATVLPVWLVHHDAPDWIRSSVASLLASEGVRPAITVVDNSRSLVPGALPPDVAVVVPDRNLGFTGGANLGLRAWLADPGAGDVCLIGSHDLHVAPDALAVLVEAAASHTDHGILAPRFRSGGAVGPVVAADGGARGPSRASHDRAPDERGSGIVERRWVAGGGMLVRRRCIEHIGVFDERFGSYVEDVDLCLRATDAGWRCGVVTDAEAWGLGTASAAGQRLKYANQVLLRAKRADAAAGVRGIVGLAVHGTRSAVIGVVPVGSRSAEDRRTERARARARWQAIPLVVRRLRAFRRPGPLPGRSAGERVSGR
jgi:GT2 family glycosyltransferase